MPKEDDHTLEAFVTKLIQWEEYLPRHRLGRDLLALALIFGDDLECFASGQWGKRIAAALKKERRNLALHIEDYGKWRACHGNAGYDVYVDAQAGHSEVTVRLEKAVAAYQRLARCLDFFIRKFTTTDSIAGFCVNLRSTSIAMAARKWGPNVRHSSALQPQDIALCLRWADIRQEICTELDGLGCMAARLSNYDICRLLSARAAERSAADHYRDLGFKVADISSTQLDAADERWKDFDLLADDSSLDVKNARRSFSSPDTYVEHCVPKFKVDRHSGGSVSIVGVLSDYLPDPLRIISGEPSCTVLGEVNETDIIQLKDWIRDRFSDQLDLNGLWNPTHIPGWLFELPERQYVEREAVIVQIKALLDDFQHSGLASNDIPGWLMTLCPQHPVLQHLTLPAPHKEILSDLISLGDSVGLTRPSLFVYAIGLFLEAMTLERDCQEVADALRELVFVDSEQRVPLGLIDTQEYIANVIGMLLRISSEVSLRNLRFTAFRMPHPAILMGQRPDGAWSRLIAYCGGWREEPRRVPCGASPLFFGRHDECPACGRLICNQCGFCSTACLLVSTRQQAVTEKFRADRSPSQDDAFR